MSIVNDQPESVSVVDLMYKGVDASVALLGDFFEADHLDDIAPFVPVLVAMQSLPESIMEEVGIGILGRFFTDNGFDPKEPKDRAEVKLFSPVIAKAIDHASQMIMHQMHQQAERDRLSKKRILGGVGR